MSKYKVCVYAICKNEEKFVEKWMGSMQEADLVVVTDTGSTDGTVEQLRARGATVYVDEIKPWRFDVARNISLEHVPEDIDICVCTDLDEILLPGWREKLEWAWTKDAAQGKYLYNWSLKADGSPDVQFIYFKVHTRKNFKWVYPIHEIIRYTGTAPYKEVFIEGMVLNHYPDTSKSRGSYLSLLEMATAEHPEDDRMMYYLGREYMYKGEWEKCIETLRKHLTLASATWCEERCASMRWIAASYSNIGNQKEAYSWYYRAIAEMPDMREPYVEFARCAYWHQDWVTTYVMAKEALKITQKSITYVNSGYAWDYTPDDLASVSSYYLGLYETSLEHAKKALSFEPDNIRLQNNVRSVEYLLGERAKR